MSIISLNKFQDIYTEFVDTRLMPNAPAHIQWVLGGSVFIIGTKGNEFINAYTPKLKSIGLVNDQNQLDIELARGFINSAFDKCSNVEMFGFKFNKADGEALINIMEKYQDA